MLNRAQARFSRLVQQAVSVTKQYKIIKTDTYDRNSFAAQNNLQNHNLKTTLNAAREPAAIFS